MDVTTTTTLADRVALVTGAAGGLGAGIAGALSSRGATVVCCDRVDASAVARSLPGKPGIALELDVTDSFAVDSVFDQVADELGRLDILVNNAGVSQSAMPLTETPDELIDRVLDVNVKGVLYCARAAGRLMRERRQGRIVNIASQAGKCGVPNWAPYSASKAAVVAATQSQALELAGFSVTVNCVCPGPMLTEMTRRDHRETALAQGGDWQELLAARGASVPVGRLGTPEDVGAMVAWIVSDEAAFTTGASFNVTGGESVHF